MRFAFIVTVDAERTEGKFASRDELAAQILDELEGANPGTLEGDNGGQYEVGDFDVQQVDVDRRGRMVLSGAQAVIR